MELSADLLKRFVQVTNDKEPKKKETTVYGTVVKNGESTYVKLDGSSNTLTPAFLGVCADNNDRVIVNIKNHSATITNNLTSPPKTGIYSEILNENFNIITGRIASIEMITSKAITTETLSAALVDAGYISAEEIHSEYIRADELVSKIATIDSLTANDAFIRNIQTVAIDADYIKSAVANVGYLTADSAVITSLQTDKLNTSELNAKVADLGYLTADSAVITGKLDANQLSAEVAKLGYLDAKMANIDFANLNKANIGQLFANVGLISSATITDGHVTGYLDSVEVNANKITAGTLAVDRLLIKDSSGNYKMATYDSSGNLVITTVNGSVITNRTITADHLVAGTITANEINMTNLVGNSAFVNAINTNSIVVSASNNASSALSTANTASSTANSALSTANSASSNASTALSTVNNMEIGGRNLYLGTKDFSGEWIRKNDWIVTSETYKGFTVISRTGPWFGITQLVDVIEGETYTFSGYVKKTGGNTFVFIGGYGVSAANDGCPIGTSVNVWEHFSVTSTILSSGTCSFRVENSSSTATTYVCGLKLEKGNKATDWTPAPEDTEESINNVNTKAQGIIDNIYTPNTTTINGGKITTGSIKAAQIDVTDLFAQNITASGTITGATLKGSYVECNSFYAHHGDISTKNYISININDYETWNDTNYNAFKIDHYSNDGKILKNFRIDHNTICMASMIYNNDTKAYYGKSSVICSDAGEVQLNGEDNINLSSEEIYFNGKSFFNGDVALYGSLYENGTALSNKYLGINANAVSATKLLTPRFINNASFDGSANIRTSDSWNLSLGSTGYTNNYAIFARTSSTNLSGNCGATLLVTDCGDFGSPITGAWLIQISNRGSTPTMDVTVLRRNYAGEVTFGYYEDTSNGYFYFGVFTTYYRSDSNITVLRNNGVQIEKFYDYTTAPSGWTPVSVRTLLDTSGNASSATKATQDGNGNVISSTYLHLSGGILSANNQWLSPAKLQLMRYDETNYTDRACIGVTDGNLHLDAYNGSGIYLNYYNSGKTYIGNTASYFFSEDGSYYNGNCNYANSAGSAPASDVYSWAKQSTKPSYALNEITGSSDIFKVVTYSYNRVSVASGSSATVTPSRTNIPSGYTAVAVYTVNSGGGRIYPRAHSADGTIVLVNESSAATVTPIMKVLCVKSICVG